MSAPVDRFVGRLVEDRREQSRKEDQNPSRTRCPEQGRTELDGNETLAPVPGRRTGGTDTLSPVQEGTEESRRGFGTGTGTGWATHHPSRNLHSCTVSCTARVQRFCTSQLWGFS